MFTDKGYYQFKPPPHYNDSVTRCWQKRFDDERGKKYFININEWDNRFIKQHMLHPDNVPDYLYEYDTQMYAKGSHDAINIEFLSSWDIDRVEAFMEKIWATGEFDYYEEW